jgi:Cytochrome b5-like Heme/Steroid binding domain
MRRSKSQFSKRRVNVFYGVIILVIIIIAEIGYIFFLPMQEANKTIPLHPGSSVLRIPQMATSSVLGCLGGCTQSTIASHNKRSDCWVSLGRLNKVYDVTAYVADLRTHPGKDLIVPHCGEDIYEYFIESAAGHQHSNTALDVVLEAYYIGTLKNVPQI